MDMNSNSNNSGTKSKNTKLIVIIIAVVIFLSCSCCCCGTALLFSSDDKRGVEDSESSSVSASESSEFDESSTVDDTEETTTLISTTTTTSNDKSSKTSENIAADTTTSVQPELTQLYIDFFEPYIDSIAKLSPQEFKQDNNEKFAAYDVNIIEGNEEDLWNFEIKDNNNNYMTLWFYPDNDMYKNPLEDWTWTLCLITYNAGDKEISISDEFHIESTPIYKTHDKNREEVNQEVKSIDELIEFMFIPKENSTDSAT